MSRNQWALDAGNEYDDLRKLEAEHLWFNDAESHEVDIIRKVCPFTMTSPGRILTLLHAVQYVVSNKIPGDFVECGVWRGGSSMAMGLMLLTLGDKERNIYLYDTFAGMPLPTEFDTNLWGESAIERHQQLSGSSAGSEWAYASFADVSNNMCSTGLPESRYCLVEGLVENTIPTKAPDIISILRLDTDWYESTRHELEHLVRRMPRGGVVIVDDYGHWKGSKKAVDEFLCKYEFKPFLHRIDYAARLWIIT